MDEELAQVVGQRVKRLRLQKGISLRQQATLAGVSPSALSALENGRGGMSLATLQRVGEEFGLSITELLALPSDGDRSPEPDPDRVELFEQCASESAPVRRGAGTLYHLLGGGKGHLLQPYMLSFLPGGGFTSDSIAHPGEEFAYVVVGEVEMVIGTDVHRLRQGDAIRFRTDTAHSFRNASSTGIAVVIGAATPPW